jgi:phosphate transport system permease protein
MLRRFESLIKGTLFACTCATVLITVMIVASVLFESLQFFEQVPFFEFLFGTHWSPQVGIRPDQAGGSGAFGAVPVLLGTLMITLIAMLVATPIGLFSAIYLSEYATSRQRTVFKPIIEILAGIPTVVYGYFAVTTFAPLLRDMGIGIGVNIAAESALAAGVVMGIMIIPFVMSLSADALTAVPATIKDASFGMGATRSETIKQVLVPSAFPGIVSAVLLGVSRGIGETMIVVMAAGLAANMTISPLDAVTTVTVQIVTLLIGDHEFDSAKTLAAFALGLLLFVFTLLLNALAQYVTKKFGVRYD